jgi:hypothetical protein
MLCLSDNDLLLNLAAWNLLQEFTRYLEADHKVTRENIYVLESFVRQLKQDPWREKYGEKAIERAVRFCDSLPTLYALTYDEPVLTALSRVDNIDRGEALLAAVALKYESSLIATNDINFIAALEADPTVAPYRDALSGRILHLRQVIVSIYEMTSYKHLKPCITSQKNTDRCIYQAFSKDHSRAIADLHASVEDVRRLGGNLLYPIAPKN